MVNDMVIFSGIYGHIPKVTVHTTNLTIIFSFDISTLKVIMMY